MLSIVSTRKRGETSELLEPGVCSHGTQRIQKICEDSEPGGVPKSQKKVTKDSKFEKKISAPGCQDVRMVLESLGPWSSEKPVYIACLLMHFPFSLLGL